MASQGTFVLADLGGYTSFLTGVGIEHAKEITTFLFNSLLKCNHGRWKVANIEGDCIFFYRPGREDPDELVSHIRKLYEDFLRGSIDIARRSACPCGACTRTNDLRLKFIVHAGEFDTQRIGGRTELIAPDVVLAHRLLKNRSPYVEYVLCTRGYSSLEGVTDLPRTEGNDAYDDVGRVEYVCLDLEPLRVLFLKSLEFYVDETNARFAVRRQIDAPPDVVWDATMDLETGAEWGSTIVELAHIQGERGRPGEIYRCLHTDGSTAVHFTVCVDQARRRKTEKIWVSRLVKDTYMTIEARALPDGRTLAGLYVTSSLAVPVVSHVLAPLLARVTVANMRKDMAALKAFCEKRARVPASGSGDA